MGFKTDFVRLGHMYSVCMLGRGVFFSNQCLLLRNYTSQLNYINYEHVLVVWHLTNYFTIQHNDEILSSEEQ